MTERFNLSIVISIFCISLSFLLYHFIYLKKDPILQEAEAYQGKSVPTVSLKNITASNQYSEEFLKGDVLLVYLISNCDASKKEIQLLSRLIAQSNTNFEPKTKIYAIMSEKEEVVKDYIAKNNVEIPVLIDEDAKLLKELDLKYFPSNFRIKDGVIKKAFFGSPKNTAVLKELINDY